MASEFPQRPTNPDVQDQSKQTDVRRYSVGIQDSLRLTAMAVGGVLPGDIKSRQFVHPRFLRLAGGLVELDTPGKDGQLHTVVIDTKAATIAYCGGRPAAEEEVAGMLSSERENLQQRKLADPLAITVEIGKFLDKKAQSGKPQS